jgi:signal transduction histidine kinase
MKQGIKILLIDDDEEDYIITKKLIENIPHRGYRVSWTPDYENALMAIEQAQFDVFLIDYRLGIHSGLELIQKTTDRGFSRPLILLTGQGDIEIDEKAMKAGASDYLVKGSINPDYLDRSIRYSIEHCKNIEEIKKLNTDLEKRVVSRTQELEEVIQQLEKTNKHLEQALEERKKAEIQLKKAFEKEKELNELKSRFVSMASHEFRTPLSTILSSASLIERYEESNEAEKRLKHINRIKNSVTNLTDILNDLLSIGKLEEGKVSINAVTFNLNNFSRDIVQEMQLISQSSNIINYKHIGSEIVTTDKQLLRNILVNLLSNALKYSSEGKGVDFLTDNQGTELKMTIKDYGMGIPDQDKKHLFSRFFRATNVTNIQGTGLGLNIVKKYIELLKGDINFESELNVGTTFYITIPLNNNTHV